jgi:nucleoside-triphosphatase
LLVSGARGAGKTTLCQRLVDHLRRQGWQTAGVRSPAVLAHGRKTGIQVQDLRTGESRLLARSTADAASPVSTIRWAFDEQALRWGNDVLAGAVPCDLLVVDELGPLELQRGQGWLAGLAALDSGQYRLALLVMRPELLEAAQARWPGSEVITVDDVKAVDGTAAEVLGRILINPAHR